MDKTQVITIENLKNVLRFKLHKSLKFTSTRQRMSVIVESLETKVIYLFTKGADSIMHKISKNVREYQAQIDLYA